MKYFLGLLILLNSSNTFSAEADKNAEQKPDTTPSMHVDPKCANDCKAFHDWERTVTKGFILEGRISQAAFKRLQACYLACNRPKPEDKPKDPQ